MQIFTSKKFNEIELISTYKRDYTQCSANQQLITNAAID